MEYFKLKINNMFLKNLFPKKTRIQINDIIKKINFLYYKTKSYDIYWNNEYEKLFLEKNFGDITKFPDFIEKYQLLINGLDKESIDCVAKIIYNIKIIVNTKNCTVDLFSQNEKNKLKELEDEFYSRIYRIDDNVFIYNKYILPINHFEPSVFYYKHGISHLKDIKRVEGSTVLDIGGFIGDSALVFSELNPSRIITFEPVTENISLMKKTIELNRKDNITIENIALIDRIGKTSISISGSESSLVKTKPTEYNQTIEIETTTLDHYVNTNDIKNISLIKVDIEGAEQAFLKGAEQTIRRFKPILLISIYHNADDFFNIKPMIERWNLGYIFSIHKPTFGNSTSEILLIAETPNHFNK